MRINDQEVRRIVRAAIILEATPGQKSNLLSDIDKRVFSVLKNMTLSQAFTEMAESLNGKDAIESDFLRNISAIIKSYGIVPQNIDAASATTEVDVQKALLFLGQNVEGKEVISLDRWNSVGGNKTGKGVLADLNSIMGKNALGAVVNFNFQEDETPQENEVSQQDANIHEIIEKIGPDAWRLYSEKKNKATGKRKNLGTFDSRKSAEKHEREVEYFKRSK